MFITAVLTSFAVYVLIGFVVGRRVKTKTDYYVSGRRAPAILITGSLVASYMSTVGFTGDVGLAYDGYPILLLILLVISYSGYIIGPLVFGRYLRRARVLTIPEFLGRRFNSGALQAVAGITVVLGVGIYLLAVTQGLALLMAELLGFPFGVSLLILLVLYTVLTLVSGSPGVLVTDTVMFLVFTAAAIACMVWVIVDQGGPGRIAAEMGAMGDKPDVLLPHGLTGADSYMGTPTEAIIWALIFGLVWATVITVSPWQSSRYMMARSEHTAIRGGAMAAGVMLIFYIPLAFGALSLNLYSSDLQPSTGAFIWAAQEVMPIGLGALALCGILAAGLSTASTFLSLVAFSVTHDIKPRIGYGGQSDSDRASLRHTRFAVATVGLIVFVVAYLTPPAILEIAYFAGTLFAASWGPICLLAIYSRRVTTRGALASMVAGFVSVIFLEVVKSGFDVDLPIYLHPAIVGFVVSLVAVALGSMGRVPDRVGLVFRDEIRQVPTDERGRGSFQRTRSALLGLASVSVVSVLVLVFFYYIPVVSVAG